VLYFSFTVVFLHLLCVRALWEMRVQLFCYVVVFGLVFFLIHVGIPFYSVAKRAIVFSVSTLELAASGSASGPSSRYDLCCFV
jgi:hypothetical protein